MTRGRRRSHDAAAVVCEFQSAQYDAARRVARALGGVGRPRMARRIFLIAGETSGDAIGAKLMLALQREHKGKNLQFSGVGGKRMTDAGLQTLFPMDDINVMGFGELIPALPRLAYRLSQTISAAREAQPDLVVGIDSKAFCLRVLAALRRDRRSPSSGPALVQYVAPSAWAFSDAPKRAAKLANAVDELLVLLPFERDLFEAAGVPCTFVGHPALQAAEDDDDLTAAIDESRGSLCLLPGSRPDEVSSNLPIMLDAAERIASSLLHSPADGAIDQLLLPAPPSVRSLVEETIRARPSSSLPALVTTDRMRHRAYRASRLALACSGTVNVELALARTPQVALYRSNRLTSFVVRHIVRPTVQHATLPNILNARDGEASALIPELLFEECTSDAVADEAIRLLANPEAAKAQVAASERVLHQLAVREDDGRVVPSATVAARALLRRVELS